MILHLGKEHTINSEQVVMIGDMNTSNYSPITKKFLKTSQEEGFIVDYSKDSPKSFILTEETVYYSMISAKTLGKRLNKKI